MSDVRSVDLNYCGNKNTLNAAPLALETVLIDRATLVIVAAVVMLPVQSSYKPQKHFICALALILEPESGNNRRQTHSHTKAASLSRGSGSLAFTGLRLRL